MDSSRDKTLSNLLKRAQAGDHAAYDSFLREVATILRAYLSRRLAPSEAVEDVLQDSLIAIHRARHSYLPTRPVGPWLYTICDHRVGDYFRKVKRRVRTEVALKHSLRKTDGASTSEAVEESSWSGLMEAFRTLPPRQRSIIEMLKWEDLSVREVASRTGMSESAVKVTAFRGYEAIRKILGIERK